MIQNGLNVYPFYVIVHNNEVPLLPTITFLWGPTCQPPDYETSPTILQHENIYYLLIIVLFVELISAKFIII